MASFLAAAAPIIGGALGFLGARRGARAVDAQTQAMSNLASRPQMTALGSYFNPGGLSAIAPAIQGPRAQILANMPGYKAGLQSSYNNYLANLGDIRNELTGGTGSPYIDMMYQPPASSVLGARPMAPVAPIRADFTTTRPSAFSNLIPGGQIGPAQLRQFSTTPDLLPQSVLQGGALPAQTAFDESGFNRALAERDEALAAQSDYDRRVAEYEQAQQQFRDENQYVPGMGGLESEFMQAALRPLRTQAEQAVSGIQRGAQRREISGSSLANQQVINARQQFGAALADTSARVRDMQLARRLGIDEAALNAGIGQIQNFGALDQQTQGILTQQAAEQLALLGLSSQQIANMMTPLTLQAQNQQNYMQNLGNLAFGTGTALGQVPWGSIFGGGSNNPTPNSPYNPTPGFG